MPERYVSIGVVILIDAVAIALAAAVLALIYWLVTGAGTNYLAVLSNLLFLVGGILLTFGALVEFFHMKGTKEIRKLLFIPQALLGRHAFLEAADKDEESAKMDAGWLLILLGATLIIFSIVLSLEHLI